MLSTINNYTQQYAAIREEEKRRCELSYLTFFKCAWHILEPENELLQNWHIKYLCGIVQQETERVVSKLNKPGDYIINIAPRSLKSYIFNIMWTPWAWTKYPWLKFINNSFVEDLAIDLCVKSRRIIESDWYQGYWGAIYKLATDKNTRSWYDNDRGGMRRTSSTKGNIYGTGADFIINDDPQDPKMGGSELERKTVIDHHTKVLYTRLNNQRTGLRITVQQRLHEEDLTGYLMSRNPEKHIHICIPVEETDLISPKELHEQYKDGLFFPQHPSFSRETLLDARLPTNLGPMEYATQMLQQPIPDEGAIFKKYWWRFWQPKGANLPPIQVRNTNKKLQNCVLVTLPENLEIVIDSWDTAFEGLESSDDVVGVKIARHGANKYLLDVIKGKLNFKETKDKIKELRLRNTSTSATLIEKSANGPAIINDLGGEIPALIPIKTGRLSKEERVRLLDNVPYAAQVEAGNIYLPHPNIAPWAEDFIMEHAKFPKGAQDGQVDAAGQAVNYLTTTRFIWPNYNPSNPQHFGPLSLNEFTEHYRYGVIFVSKNGYITFLALYWDVYNWKLYVCKEYQTSGQSISNLALYITQAMNLKTGEFQGIWCNSDAHDDTAKSASKIINSELANLGSNNSVIIPHAYDRLGSITLASLMFSRDQIFVDLDSNKASTQFSVWSTEKDNPPTLGFEFCECLCLGISQINKQFRIVKPQDNLVDYKQKVTPAGKPVDDIKKEDMWQLR